MGINWQASLAPKKILALATVFVLAVLAVLAGPSTQTADAHHKPSLPGVVVQPPFSGYWNKFGTTDPYGSPSRHHIVYGGDWSVDMYKDPGYSVKIRAYPASSSATWSVRYKVEQVRPACASGVIADGGYRVRVGLYKGTSKIGHVDYAHLTSIKVTAGAWVPHGQTLGFTAGFNYSSNPGTCYEVTNNGGVHVHIEVYSVVHYSCFRNLKPRTWLDYWSWIGKIGGQYALSKRQYCR